MATKFENFKAFVSNKASQAAHTMNEFVESEDTKAAVARTKSAVSAAADGAIELGKRAKNSEMGKDALTGAAIGAAVAVPIPIIGPLFGAVVGAGAGMVMGRKGGDSPRPIAQERQVTLSAPTAPPQEIDIHKILIDLDDLRQKGILTQEEFDIEKRKVLGR